MKKRWLGHRQRPSDAPIPSEIRQSDWKYYYDLLENELQDKMQPPDEDMQSGRGDEDEVKAIVDG